MVDSRKRSASPGSEPRRRRSLRWCDHDYRRAGCYVITAVSHARACLFGEVVGAEMRVNEAGRMIGAVWQEIPSFYPGVEIDEFVVMPNHVHGILLLGAAGALGESAVTREEPGDATRNRMSLSVVMQRFKTLTTTRYIDGVRRAGWPRFTDRLWQRSFHDRVIRDDDEWNAFRQYILDNPVRWTIDRENPDASAGSSPILFEPES